VSVKVTVAWSPGPREVLEWEVVLGEGATLRQAVMASGLPDHVDESALAEATVGIWGRKADWQQAVRDRDRVEVYRPLLVDPKVARRERFKKQGSRAAGLFANRRSGGKPGY